MSTKQCEEKLKDKGVRPTACPNSYIAETVGTNISHFLARIGSTTGNIGQIDHFTLFSDLVGASRHPRFEDGSGSMKYEICRSDTETCFIENRHIHFYCEVCHKTYCMDHIKIPVVQLPEGFIMDTINYTVKGICPACKSPNL